MKILAISPLFYPQIAGSQQYMEDLYVELCKQHRDIEVDVLAYNTLRDKSFEKYRGLNVYRMPCWNTLPEQFALAHPIPLIKFLWKNRQKYDLIHCNTRFFDSTWWAPFYAKMIGKKIILTDHCASNPVHHNPIVSFIAKAIDLTVVRVALHFFDKIYSISRATQTFLKDTYGINSELMVGGVNLKIFKSHKKRSKKVSVIFVGRMIHTKGVKMLFQAAQEFPDTEFTFIGPGPLRNELKQIIKEKQIKNVHIIGTLDQPQVAQKMAQADIFALPSYHHEGIPTVIKEAGAAGLAVITTDAGGTTEIIHHGKTGVLLQQNDQNGLEDALARLIKDQNYREMIAQNFHKYALENFDWEKISEDFFNEVCKQG